MTSSWNIVDQLLILTFKKHKSINPQKKANDFSYFFVLLFKPLTLLWIITVSNTFGY